MELMALVTGNENYDWNELEKSAEYKGEYHAEHAVIKMFWEVFHDFALDQKRHFLLFLTGTDRVPILGMKALKITIQSAADDAYLPVAHPFIAQLDLPVYNTKEKLRYKLLQAIQQSEALVLYSRALPTKFVKMSTPRAQHSEDFKFYMLTRKDWECQAKNYGTGSRGT
ncbi:probable E3 ubiquitin-protein ligase HERC4 [Macrobrachium rosenbergii]|uniref:probable E3 ubiquitin-protein ligase HERC4 n=1 Tax=Macrobrachium rosenbergii TaxID=79674 RepID=UPI0034D4F367